MRFLVIFEDHIDIRPELYHPISITNEYMISLACEIEDYLENNYRWNVKAYYDDKEFCLVVRRDNIQLNRFPKSRISHVAYIRANELKELSGKLHLDTRLIADAYYNACEPELDDEEEEEYP